MYELQTIIAERPCKVADVSFFRYGIAKFTFFVKIVFAVLKYQNSKTFSGRQRVGFHAGKIFLLMVLLIGLLPAGCAVNPVTGQQELMLLSEQDESQLGLKTDRSVSEQYGIYADRQLQDYIQSLGGAMARASHRPGLPWQFKVMDSEIINAFAAPGGYIYVTRGLLAAVNNEAELVGVLGHEIGHVTARHSAQQYSKSMLANVGLQLGQVLAGSYGDMLGPALQSGAGLLFLKFGRDDEREADALGVDYATRAGYDAARTADFFVTLQRQATVDGGDGQRLPDFFSSHPNPVDREQTVRSLAYSIQAKSPGKAFLTNRDAYLRRIDGLVFGKDPRQGFRDGDWYFLPQHRVKLPIPAQWKFEREGNSLQMAHPQGKAAVLVSIRPQSRMDQEITAFLKGTGARVQQERRLTTDGMPTRLLLSLLSDGQKRAVVISRFFQKGDDVFAVHGLTGEAAYSALGDVIQQPGKGFGVMSDPDKLNPRPKRVVIKVAARAATLDSLLDGYGVDRELRAKTAWLNGRQLTDRVAAGELIKIVE